jgi:hypothetical protein
MKGVQNPWDEIELQARPTKKQRGISVKALKKNLSNTMNNSSEEKVQSRDIRQKTKEVLETKIQNSAQTNFYLIA